MILEWCRLHLRPLKSPAMIPTQAIPDLTIMIHILDNACKMDLHRIEHQSYLRSTIIHKVDKIMWLAQTCLHKSIKNSQFSLKLILQHLRFQQCEVFWTPTLGWVMQHQSWWLILTSRTMMDHWCVNFVAQSLDRLWGEVSEELR